MLTPLAASPQQLREFFTEAGFTFGRFKEDPTMRDLPSRRLGNLPALLERTAEPTALNVLLRWFLLGQTQEIESFAELVPASVLTELLETGTLVREANRFTPAVMLTPCEEFLFAADPARTLESPESSGMILWPNPSTRMLQMFTIRRPTGTTLDLGAGCGILAVLASVHSRHVVATDLNPRAAEFVAFNAWLNGVTNLECLTGDTFEPVRGRTFDLIVSNPPFFVTPSAGQMYCENSMELDGYCRELVRAAPGYLNEGGYLQITFEWVQVRGQSWQDRLAEWLKDSGCDAWILRSYARKAADYAAERIGRMMPFSTLTANQRLDEWMAYYRAREVEEVHGGILAMRRRSGRNWLRIEHVPGLDCTEPFGESIEELFANQNRLEADRSTSQMLAWRPRVAPDTRIDQQLHLVAGEWKPSSMQIRRVDGLPSSLAADPQVVEFLRQCDGTRTLADLADNLAPVVHVNPEQVREQCCAVMRKLVERRLVLL
ncbi:MAG: methyltransferase [Candidatus Sulfopaludibacter sp.]|nr:methyltransferase [Candidatus Sulfopaludibacter sp.]